jgi:hypothetical protein
MVSQIVALIQMIAKCRRHILMWYRKSKTNSRSSQSVGFCLTIVGFHSPPPSSQIHGVVHIVCKVMLAISNHFLGILVLLLNISERGDSEVLYVIKILIYNMMTKNKCNFFLINYIVFIILQKIIKFQSCALLRKFPASYLIISQLIHVAISSTIP